MNKIKTVKIKNEDGSVSEESYSIAADALNIDMANGKNVQETIGTIDVDQDGDIAAQLNKKINKSDIIDNLDSSDNNKVLSAKQGKVLNEAVAAANLDIQKKIYYFNTVEDMKTANLQVGDTCQTLGYYSANDGGAGLYKIVDDDTLVDDGGSIHELENGLKAELIIDDVVNVKQFGAKENDNNFDNAQIIYNSLKFMQSKNGGIIYIPAGIFNINSQINIDFDMYSTLLIGTKGVPSQNKGSVLKYNSNGFMINFNGRCNNCEFKDFMILNNNNNGMSFNLTAHKTQLNNITINNAIKGLLFNTGTYTRINNLTYISSNSLSEYGIQIGSEQQSYSTEFFYITNSSIDFSNVSSGIALNILKTGGGIWCEHNDFCNTLGKAIQIDNQAGGSSNYYNFDNNNISGCKYGFYLKASTGNIGGVYISNQRIAINGNNIDERFIYTEKLSNYNCEIHTSNLYLRTRNFSITPTYLFEIKTNSCNDTSEFSFDGGNMFDSPIYCDSNIRKIRDIRIEYGKQLNTDYFSTTGDKAVRLSNYKCLIKGNSFGRSQTGIVNSSENIYFIKFTYDNDGYPIANLRIVNIPNSRINIITSDEFYSIESAT